MQGPRALGQRDERSPSRSYRARAAPEGGGVRGYHWLRKQEKVQGSAPFLQL